MMYDSQGNLILPKGAIENFMEEMKKMKHPGRKKTGVMVTCNKCGHTWERMTRKAGRVRCHPCKNRIELEAIE